MTDTTTVVDVFSGIAVMAVGAFAIWLAFWCEPAGGRNEEQGRNR